MSNVISTIFNIVLEFFFVKTMKSIENGIFKIKNTDTDKHNSKQRKQKKIATPTQTEQQQKKLER